MGQDATGGFQNPNLGTQQLPDLNMQPTMPSPSQRQMAMGMSPESATQGTFGGPGAMGGKPAGGTPQQPMRPQGPQTLQAANAQSPAAQGDFRQKLAQVMQNLRGNMAGGRMRGMPMQQGPGAM